MRKDAGLATLKVPASVELGAVTVLAGIDLATFIRSPSIPGIVADVALFASLVLVLQGGKWAPTMLILPLVATAAVPARAAGVGLYAPLIAVAHLVSNKHSRRTVWGITLTGLLAGAWSSRRAHGALQWLVTSSVWGFLYLMAWLIGTLVAHRRAEAQLEMEQALEQQRLMVAAELHDNVAHDLALIVMRAHHAQLHPEAVDSVLPFVIETATGANRYLRHLMSLLKLEAPVRPISLPDAIERSRRDLDQAQLPAPICVHGDLAVAPQPVADAGARILKEAVNNMVRHAHPNQPGQVDVTVGDEHLNMTFCNGWDGKSGEGLGLTGMKQRAETLGGTFVAGGAADVWRVTVSIPFREVG